MFVAGEEDEVAEGKYVYGKMKRINSPDPGSRSNSIQSGLNFDLKE
jgi:hypothetical protein